MNALAVAPIADEVGVMQATGLTTYCGLVYPWHCDHMGHMNVMWYTGKFDEASWAFLARFGVTAAYMREHGRRMAAVEQTIVYRQELFAGDTVTIQSTLLEVRQKSIRFSHQMYKNGGADVAAACNLVGVHLDAQTRKSCALPEDIAERARRLIGA